MRRVLCLLPPLAQDRWAEPLHDALPRLLLHDLILLRGAEKVWLAPAPPGVRAHQGLRVQNLALDADRARYRRRMQARCTWQPLLGDAASRVPVFSLQVPLADAPAAAVLQAHSAALLQLPLRPAGGRPPPLHPSFRLRVEQDWQHGAPASAARPLAVAPGLRSTRSDAI